MKNHKKGFSTLLIIVVIALLAVVSYGYYFAKKSGFIADNGQGDILQPEAIFRDILSTGTPEQKEEVLDEFIFKAQKLSQKLSAEEKTYINNTIAPFVPAVIEAILDDTSLPGHEDTGWGYVYHQAASAMNTFAYKVDRIQRDRDSKFSFYYLGGIAKDKAQIKEVHDNWLKWWNANKNNSSAKFTE